MKIKLYFGQEDAIKKSGIGRAFVHQKKALELSGIPYTTDKDDLDYDILHINTVWPDSFKIINQARKYNKKIVYHAHSTEEDFKNSFMFSNTVSGVYKKWLISMYTKGDYIGALVTRVNSMTNGIYGQIFCDEFEVDNTTLFDESTIVDLSRVGSSETKSLIMGILILKLTEHRMANANSTTLF